MNSATFPLLVAAEPTRSVAPAPRPEIHTFHDLVTQHKEPLFRWVLARIGQPGDENDPTRRAFVEAAVAMRRRRGETDFVAWLYTAAVRVARRLASGDPGQRLVPETALTGLLPELRAVLRLVARGGIGMDEAGGLLPLPVDHVRRRLVHTRGAPALRGVVHHTALQSAQAAA